RCWNRWPWTPNGPWRRLRTASLRQGWFFLRRRVPPAQLLECLWMVVRPCESPFVPLQARESHRGGARAPVLEAATVRLFLLLGKRGTPSPARGLSRLGGR